MSKESILVRVGGAVALVTGVVGAGAAIESKSIHEASADNNRQPICHSGNKNWTIIRPDENSYDAHLKDWQGKAKGHDNDYFAYDKDGDGDIDKDDCGFIASPTPTHVITPIPTLTPKITETFMPSPTIVFTPTETQANPTEIKNTPTEKESNPSEELVCPPEDNCYCYKVLGGTIAASIQNAQGTDTAGEIKAAQMIIDNTNKNATAQAKSESTATPNALTSNQVETPTTYQVNESLFKSEVTPVGKLTLGAILLASAFAVEKKVKKYIERKKKS